MNQIMIKGMSLWILLGFVTVAAQAGFQIDYYELAGCMWTQGWKYMYAKPAIPEYADKRVGPASDIRDEFNSRNRPFIIGELNGDRPVIQPGSMADIRNMQREGTRGIK